jgi:hypothetical protein
LGKGIAGFAASNFFGANDHRVPTIAAKTFGRLKVYLGGAEPWVKADWTTKENSPRHAAGSVAGPLALAASHRFTTSCQTSLSSTRLRLASPIALASLAWSRTTNGFGQGYNANFCFEAALLSLQPQLMEAHAWNGGQDLKPPPFDPPMTSNRARDTATRGRRDNL